MQFSFRDAPEWFSTHVMNNYINELHAIEQVEKTDPKYNDQKFKQIAVDFFINKGFDVWLDKDNHIWFEIDQHSPKWTFEILRN
jgi:hypothetical protein